MPSMPMSSDPLDTLTAECQQASCTPSGCMTDRSVCSTQIDNAEEGLGHQKAVHHFDSVATD